MSTIIVPVSKGFARQGAHLPVGKGGEQPEASTKVTGCRKDGRCVKILRFPLETSWNFWDFFEESVLLKSNTKKFAGSASCCRADY